MALSLGVGIVFLVSALVAAENSLHPLSDEFIADINSKQSSWKAGRNFPRDTPFAHIKQLLGALENPSLDLPVKTYDDELTGDLPTDFDARKKWPNCPSIGEIRDQGHCGSCWAFGAVEAMTDRVCIYSNGTKQFHFSAQDLVSCCDTCGFGCDGGYPDRAWQYWKDVGIVSGGEYKSGEGCRPYEILPSGVYGRDSYPTPPCVKKCQAGYNVEYTKDKHRAKKVYVLTEENSIKAELYKNGPVEASFRVYTDFLNYKSGVYVHTSGVLLSGHAIKILGYGVEDGKKYWLCANSWTTRWGDKGYFKILRGKNHVAIERQIVGGEPE